MFSTPQAEAPAEPPPARHGSRSRSLRSIALVFACSLMIAASGCGVPLIRSERMPAEYIGGKSPPPMERVPLFPDRLAGLCSPLLHRFAGPFTPQDTVQQYQTSIRPPHSKFHPVPTRPVFAPRPTESGEMTVLPTPAERPLEPPQP